MGYDEINGKIKSYIEIGEVYFWTATINNWNHLLKEDKYKESRHKVWLIIVKLKNVIF